MKKAKRLLICLFAVVLLVAGFCLMVGAWSATEEVRGTWVAFLEDKLWPSVASTVTAVCGIYLMVSPVISRLSGSSSVMGSAAKEFKETAASLKNAVEKNEQLEKRLEELEGKLRLAEDATRSAEARFGRICRVFAIGWGADERMVRSGAAREMMKVVEEYEKKEEQ